MKEEIYGEFDVCPSSTNSMSSKSLTDERVLEGTMTFDLVGSFTVVLFIYSKYKVDLLLNILPLVQNVTVF